MSFNLVLFIIFLLFQLNLHSTTKAEESSTSNEPELSTTTDTSATPTTATDTSATTAAPDNTSEKLATAIDTSATTAAPDSTSATTAAPDNTSETITTATDTSVTITTPTNTNVTTPAKTSATTPTNTDATTPANTSVTITTAINTSGTTPTPTNISTTTPTNTSATTAATTHTTTTTSSPNLITLNVCDFSNISCIVSGGENVDITDGRKFAEDINRDITQPPKGPVSSAASVCTYGLVHFAPNETNKTITMSVKQNARYLAQVDVQSLHYYYYISNSNDTLGWNKTIEVYINNETRPIDTVTTANMTTNSWQNSVVNIDPSTNVHNVSFKFKVVNINSTKTPSNESIYFALDIIKLVSSNGSYAPENNTNGSTPTMPSTTTSAVSSPSNEPDIPLILGLTLGLGLPLILVTIAFIAYYVRVHTRDKPYRKDSTEFDIPRIYSTDRYDGDNQILTTIF
ncbi:unnamed protein product [Adineta steineri]|uniref:Uncharacterized protein n=1 Tax=Adineta steineri TaxID=433720 RepID=A0A813MW44_9BILA|nr:unnamed protein product [Adineta steineri]